MVRAGPDQRHLIGRTVAMMGGGMYTQYRRIPARDCIVLPDDATAPEGASLFINPLTALGFVETIVRGPHGDRPHRRGLKSRTDARSDLPVGRDPAREHRSEPRAGEPAAAAWCHPVVNSSDPDFLAHLEEAIAATGATIGFDAIGGGKLAGQILTAMEKVASRNLDGYSRYGSNMFKQVYIYGALDPEPTMLNRSFGFSWSIGGWLLFPFLQKAGSETAKRLRARIANEFRTTFTSRYTNTISLREALKPEVVSAYERKGTGANT